MRPPRLVKTRAWIGEMAAAGALYVGGTGKERTEPERGLFILGRRENGGGRERQGVGVDGLEGRVWSVLRDAGAKRARESRPGPKGGGGGPRSDQEDGVALSSGSGSGRESKTLRRLERGVLERR